MLEFGKNTLFLGKRDQPSVLDGWYAIGKIIDYYDLMGYNCLVFKKNELHCSTNAKEYFLYKDIPNLITENIFRVNIIIIEVDKNYTHLLSSIREVTDLPVIFVGKYLEDCYNLNVFDNIYKFHIERPLNQNYNFDLSDTTYYVTDVKNNWTSSIEDIKTQYIRDKKISDIFK